MPGPHDRRADDDHHDDHDDSAHTTTLTIGSSDGEHQDAVLPDRSPPVRGPRSTESPGASWRVAPRMADQREGGPEDRLALDAVHGAIRRTAARRVDAPTAVHATYVPTLGALAILLSDRTRVMVPVDRYPALDEASLADLQAVHVGADGRSVVWPRLGLEIGVWVLLAYAGLATGLVN